jgi:hypothetical protein
MSVPHSVIELIEGSGNNFHAKVARWFHGDGWHVTVSPYYLDQVQEKVRELDLVVEKFWPISGAFNQVEGDVVVRLFVECKFIATETAFWFADKNKNAAMRLTCSLGPFRKDNTYTGKHHYLATSPRVAKLFTSKDSKTSENEPFYKALNQSLNATVAMRTQPPSHPGLKRSANRKTVTLSYPVIVCSSFSQLYGVDFLGSSPPSAIDENFQLEVQYAFADRDAKHRDEYFLIDLVEFDKLSNFATVVAEGADAAAYLASSA